MQEALAEQAVDLGPPGPDNIYGLGRLQLRDWLGEAHRHRYTGPQGWYLVGTPTSAPADAFGGRVYIWDPAEGRYQRVDVLEPFRGYWAYLPANAEVEVYGPSVEYTYLALPEAGWWQISAPFPLPRENILVSAQAGAWIYWGDAVRQGYIADVLWTYTPDIGYQRAARLEPWRGYWLRTYRPLTLLIRDGDWDAPPPPPLAPADASLPPGPPPMIQGPTFYCSPNPIRDVHTAEFGVRGILAHTITVQIFDLSGRLVWQGTGAGPTLIWHTQDSAGQYVANGVYLYRITAQTPDGEVSSPLLAVAILR